MFVLMYYVIKHGIIHRKGSSKVMGKAMKHTGAGWSPDGMTTSPTSC